MVFVNQTVSQVHSRYICALMFCAFSLCDFGQYSNDDKNAMYLLANSCRDSLPVYITAISRCFRSFL